MKTKIILITVAYILVCSTMYGAIEPSYYKNTHGAYMIFTPDTADTYLVLISEIIWQKDVMPMNSIYMQSTNVKIPDFPFYIDINDPVLKAKLQSMYSSSKFTHSEENCRKIRILKYNSDKSVKQIYNGIVAAFQDLEYVAIARNNPPEETYEICDAICKIEDPNNGYFILEVREYWPYGLSRERNMVSRFLRMTNRDSEKWGKSKDFLLYERIGKNPFLQFIGQEIQIKAIFPCKKDTVMVIDRQGRCSYLNYQNETWSDIFQLPIEGEVLDVVTEPEKHQVFWRKEGNALMSGLIKDKTLQNIRREEFGLEPAAIMDISGYKETRCILTKKRGEDGKYQVSIYRQENHRSPWNWWKDIANISIAIPPNAPKAMQGLQGSLSPIVTGKQNTSWCVSICDQTKSTTTVYMIDD